MGQVPMGQVPVGQVPMGGWPGPVRRGQDLSRGPRCPGFRDLSRTAKAAVWEKSCRPGMLKKTKNKPKMLREDMLFTL